MNDATFPPPCPVCGEVRRWLRDDDLNPTGDAVCQSGCPDPAHSPAGAGRAARTAAWRAAERCHGGAAALLIARLLRFAVQVAEDFDRAHPHDCDCPFCGHEDLRALPRYLSSAGVACEMFLENLEGRFAHLTYLEGERPYRYIALTAQVVEAASDLNELRVKAADRLAETDAPVVIGGGT